MKISKDFLLQTCARAAGKLNSRTVVFSLAMACGLFATAPAKASSFWNSGNVPGMPDATDDSNSVNLGLKFYSDTAGSVTGVRFYKGAGNTGTHTGVLWSAAGTKLGSVTFSNETASGWQQANFATPVSISANTTYVISYLAPRGNYSDDQNYSWSSLNAAPLHVSGGSSGVYAYGSGVAFPNQTWNSSNYYVDVVFAPGGGGSTQKYSISGNVSGTAATVSLSGAASATVKTDASGNFSFAGLANGNYLLSPSQSGYSFSPPTASVTINNANVTGRNFTGSKTAAHSISLSWAASASPNIAGYKVYRAGVSGGPYALVSTAMVAGTGWVDNIVSSGDTYYYVTTAVNSSGLESGYSNQAAAVVP